MRARYGEGIGVELFFAFPELQADPLTYLDADAASGASSLSANGVDFAIGQYLVIGQPGNEKSEIVQVHASTPPTATTITLAGTTAFTHNRGDIVRFIPYNQIVPSFSTDGVNFTPASAIGIRADASETYLQRPSDTSSYSYEFRFYNSTTASYSAYSDIVAATGYADNTLYAVKKRALDQLGEVRGDLITDQFLNDTVLEARRFADQNPAIFRWSFRTKFNQVLGQMLAGTWQVALPSDLRDRNTNKNILSLRFGSQNRPLTYQDRRQFNQNFLNVVHTTVANGYTSGASTIVLTSTHDLDPAGSITIANNAIGDGLTTIAYSANNLATNTLTITPASRNIASGTDAWQRAILGTSSLPTAYTVDNGTLSVDVPVGSQWDGQDMKGDYYSTIPTMNSDSDVFDEPFYDLYVPYVKYKIKYLKANGKIDRDGDTDYKDWLTGLGDLISQETPNQWVNFVPDIEGFLSAAE